MFFRSGKKIAVLEEKVSKLEKEVEMLDRKYAVKLVQTIVYSAIGLALTTLAGAWIADALGVLEKISS